MKKITALLIIVFISINSIAQEVKIVDSKTIFDKYQEGYSRLLADNDTVYVVQGDYALSFTKVVDGRVIGGIPFAMFHECGLICGDGFVNDVLSYNGTLYAAGFSLHGLGLLSYDATLKKWGTPDHWLKYYKIENLHTSQECLTSSRKLEVFKGEMFVHYHTVLQGGKKYEDVYELGNVKLRDGSNVVVFNGQEWRYLQDSTSRIQFTDFFNINDSVLLLSGNWYDSSLMQERQVWCEWDGSNLIYKDTLPVNETYTYAFYLNGEIKYYKINYNYPQRRISITEKSNTGILTIDNGLVNDSVVDAGYHPYSLVPFNGGLFLRASFADEGFKPFRYLTYWDGIKWSKPDFYKFGYAIGCINTEVVNANGRIYFVDHRDYSEPQEYTDARILYIDRPKGAIIKGFAYIDKNDNCTKDSGEEVEPTTNLYLNGNLLELPVLSDGSFSFQLQNEGQMELKCLNPYLAPSCNSVYNFYSTKDSIIGNLNFAVKPDLKDGVETVLKNKVDIKLYPNPAGNQVTINNLSNKQQLVELMDITGKVLKSFILISGETVIKTDDLPAGLYFVRTPVSSYKLIINH